LSFTEVRAERYIAIASSNFPMCAKVAPRIDLSFYFVGTQFQDFAVIANRGQKITVQLLIDGMLEKLIRVGLLGRDYGRKENQK